MKFANSKYRDRQKKHTAKNRHSRTYRRQSYAVRLVNTYHLNDTREAENNVTKEVTEVSVKKSAETKTSKKERKKKQPSQRFLDAEAQLANAKEQVNSLKEEREAHKKKLKEARRNLKLSRREFKKAKERKGIFTSILIVLLSTAAVLLLCASLWMIRTWPVLQMDELIYELSAPLEGTGTDIIDGFIRQCVVPAGCTLVFTAVLLILGTRYSRGLRRAFKSLLLIISAACIGIGAVKAYNHVDLETYIEEQTVISDFLEREYVNPASVEITFPETKRNLIYIFLESMEVTYSDQENGGAENTSLIPLLTALSEENENFSGSDTTLNGAYALKGTTWTMGALFGSTSGLPLKIDIGGNEMDTQESFFPDIITLGDILEDNGYTNVFACGSKASFGGRALYFQTHGNYVLHDYNWAVENEKIPQDYYVWWGFEDKKLIANTKEDLSALAESGEPFNYTMLTVDTHFENGYLDEEAEDVFGDQYANVIYHSDQEVAELVSWIQEQDWYENTTIIISGDHPTMDSDFLNGIDTEYERKVYTTYINAAAEKQITTERTFATFDNFPTTLAALGAEIEGDRLGLGTNLYSSRETLTEEYGKEEENAELSKNSDFMTSIAAIDKTTDAYVAVYKSSGKSFATVRLAEYDVEKEIASFEIEQKLFTDDVTDKLVLYLENDEELLAYETIYHAYNDTYVVNIPMTQSQLNQSSIRVTAYVTGGEGDKEIDIYSYSGNICLMSVSQSDLNGLLSGLRYMNQDRYAVLIASQGNATAGLTDEEKEALTEIGFADIINASQHDVRYGIISGQERMTHSGSGYIRENGYLANDIPYVIASANAEGMTSSILVGWDYSEYCAGRDGFNIVIWDQEENTLVTSLYFDTTGN